MHFVTIIEATAYSTLHLSLWQVLEAEADSRKYILTHTILPSAPHVLL